MHAAYSIPFLPILSTYPGNAYLLASTYPRRHLSYIYLGMFHLPPFICPLTHLLYSIVLVNSCIRACSYSFIHFFSPLSNSFSPAYFYVPLYLCVLPNCSFSSYRYLLLLRYSSVSFSSLPLCLLVLTQPSDKWPHS